MGAGEKVGRRRVSGQQDGVAQDREHAAEQQAEHRGGGVTYADSQARISLASTAHTPSR